MSEREKAKMSRNLSRTHFGIYIIIIIKLPFRRSEFAPSYTKRLQPEGLTPHSHIIFPVTANLEGVRKAEPGLKPNTLKAF